MSASIEIVVGDVTDMEAHVYARLIEMATAPPDVEATLPVAILGQLRGPFCDAAHTLAADFDFRPVASEQGVVAAEAVVTDPCMWSPELPHFYQAHIEARRGSEVVAEYHGKVGLRRVAPRRPVDFAPGTG